jgi:hypothetical protein
MYAICKKNYKLSPSAISLVFVIAFGWPAKLSQKAREDIFDESTCEKEHGVEQI